MYHVLLLYHIFVLIACMQGIYKYCRNQLLDFLKFRIFESQVHSQPQVYPDIPLCRFEGRYT